MGKGRGGDRRWEWRKAGKTRESTRLRLGGAVSNRFENGAINDNGVPRRDGSRCTCRYVQLSSPSRRGVMPPALLATPWKPLNTSKLSSKFSSTAETSPAKISPLVSSLLLIRPSHALLDGAFRVSLSDGAGCFENFATPRINPSSRYNRRRCTSESTCSHAIKGDAGVLHVGSL